MTTSETAQFIKDRALSLRYEASRFPTAANMAAAWLRRAATWAQGNGHRKLALDLSRQARGKQEVPH